MGEYTISLFFLPTVCTVCVSSDFIRKNQNSLKIKSLLNFKGYSSSLTILTKIKRKGKMKQEKRKEEEKKFQDLSLIL